MCLTLLRGFRHCPVSNVITLTHFGIATRSVMFRLGVENECQVARRFLGIGTTLWSRHSNTKYNSWRAARCGREKLSMYLKEGVFKRQGLGID